jgi:hypothetical protein
MEGRNYAIGFVTEKCHKTNFWLIAQNKLRNDEIVA